MCIDAMQSMLNIGHSEFSSGSENIIVQERQIKVTNIQTSKKKNPANKGNMAHQRRNDLRDSPDSPPPAQRPRLENLVNLDTDDDETQDVPFHNAQNLDLFTDDSLDRPHSPPVQLSPIRNDEGDWDYLERVEAECRDREKKENELQLSSPGYLAMLRNMFDDIDNWLDDGGILPHPDGVKQFARHNWCVRLLPRNERMRISRLRLRLDTIIEEEEARIEAEFWENVDVAELNARNSIPLCLICLNDLRNDMFTVNRLSCSHVFHTRCIARHLLDNRNPMCPNCREAIANVGVRVQFNYR